MAGGKGKLKNKIKKVVKKGGLKIPILTGRRKKKKLAKKKKM